MFGPWKGPLPALQKQLLRTSRDANNERAWRTLRSKAIEHQWETKQKQDNRTKGAAQRYRVRQNGD